MLEPNKPMIRGQFNKNICRCDSWGLLQKIIKQQGRKEKQERFSPGNSQGTSEQVPSHPPWRAGNCYRQSFQRNKKSRQHKMFIARHFDKSFHYNLDMFFSCTSIALHTQGFLFKYPRRKRNKLLLSEGTCKNKVLHICNKYILRII